MKKLIIGAIAGLIVLLIFVVALAPARIIIPWLTQDLDRLTINQPAGSLWNASIQSVSFQGQSIEDIAVKTSFISLLFGNLSSDIKVNDRDLMLDGTVKLNRQQLLIQNTRYQLEASAILDWIRLPINQLSGRFIGDINSLDVSVNELSELQANGYWQGAVVGYPSSTLELGDIHFTLERTEDGRALLTITDNPGMLNIKGTLEIGFDKQYQLNVSTQTDVPANIKQWLTQLGRIDNNRIFIQWNGRLP